jgi:hypothetical protein
MVLDVPEVLILALTALVLWVGGRDWFDKHRRR